MKIVELQRIALYNNWFFGNVFCFFPSLIDDSSISVQLFRVWLENIISVWLFSVVWPCFLLWKFLFLFRMQFGILTGTFYRPYCQMGFSRYSPFSVRYRIHFRSAYAFVYAKWTMFMLVHHRSLTVYSCTRQHFPPPVCFASLQSLVGLATVDLDRSPISIKMCISILEHHSSTIGPPSLTVADCELFPFIIS